jgi:long-chain acyl-CoA synthetase
MNKTIHQTVFDKAKKNPFKSALGYKKGRIYYSVNYRDLVKKIKKFSSALQILGIKKGDKIAILSENRPEWAISDLAIMSAGAIVVPVHSTLSSKIIQYILNHSEAKILIVSNNDLLSKVFSYKDKLRHLEKIITFEELSSEQKEGIEKEVLSFRELNNNKLEFDEVEMNSDDVCSIIYTSGTTGLPKGVMLTHDNFLSNAASVNEAIPVKRNDVFLSFLPLSHVLERLAGYYVPLIFGAKIVYAESVKQLPVNLREVKPTVLICVPRIFERFHDAVWDKVNKSSSLERKLFLWALKRERGSFSHKIVSALIFNKIRRQMGGRLRLAISGGASLSDQIERFFLKIGILILEGYGLTETSPVIAVNRERNLKIRTVGKIISGVSVEIDAETKEILVKGSNVMKGYFRNEEETEKAFDRYKWFHTGDLGYVDKDGFLTVIGRSKEMIVTSGGKNVWPEAIENLLDSDKYITGSMVIGHKRKFISALIFPDWEEIRVFLKENNMPNQEPERLINNPKVIEKIEERIERINGNLNDYERIKKFKIIANEFSQERDELTPTLKLRRHVVEGGYKKEIELMYS